MVFPPLTNKSKSFVYVIYIRLHHSSDHLLALNCNLPVILQQAVNWNCTINGTTDLEPGTDSSWKSAMIMSYLVLEMQLLRQRRVTKHLQFQTNK